MAIPKYPVLFVSPPTAPQQETRPSPRTHRARTRLQYKPVTSLSGPTDPIPVHPLAQEGEGLDYECELVAVIGKVCRDVSEADALDHVFGYAVGNDVSHREWQIAKGGGQWSLGKGFDGVSCYFFSSFSRIAREVEMYGDADIFSMCAWFSGRHTVRALYRRASSRTPRRCGSAQSSTERRSR